MRRTLILGLIALTFGLATAAMAESRYEILLLDQKWVPDEGISATLQRQLNGAATRAQQAGSETVHMLVQVYEIPNEQEKGDLERAGLDLGAYVPGNAFIAAVPASRMNQALAMQEVRTAILWDASRKVHPRLRAQDVAPWARDPTRPGWVMLMVQLHHDIDLSQLDRIAEDAGGVLVSSIEGIHGGTVWLREENLEQLAQEERILWIEEGTPPMSETNDGVRGLMRAEPVFAAPYSLDGTGVRLFVYDGGRVRPTHETFRVGAGASRVTSLDATGLSNHSTHVAGTAAGDGAPSSPGGRGRGVAVNASVLSAGYQQIAGPMLFWGTAGDIQADYVTARTIHNGDLGTNSIGSNTASNGFPCVREGDYGISSNLLDGIVRGDNPAVGSAVLMTWANGNERGGAGGRCGANYLTTAPPSCAKNPIHVGAVYSDGGGMTSFSSWGPCDDGRLKPIVSAPGCETARVTGEASVLSSFASNDTAYSGICGTSMATPAVAGTVALLIEDWRAGGYGGANARPLPALVKAMMIQSAIDYGQDGPDFIYGYGEVDTKALIDLLRAGNNTLNGTTPVRWGTNTISNGVAQSYTINVAAGTGELKASVAWDDFAAASFAGIAPVNNLNLEVVSPGGTIFRPWILNAAAPHQDATTGINNLDNQEQVRITNPAAGLWTVRVVGTAVPQGPQSYGLTFSSLPFGYDAGLCTTTAYGFETGTDGFTLTGGAARLTSPAPGHGTWSLRLGSAANTAQEAFRNITIPANVGRAEVTFFWHMTTQRLTTPWNSDFFIAEIRDANTNATLDVLDIRFDGWQQGQWMQQAHADVSQFAGQTVRLAFRAVNDAAFTTTFWVDDITLTTCPLAGTDVWSRDLPGDTGIEPDPLPGNMWMSPDVWNRNADDGLTAHQNPELGQPNYLHANVRNRSLVEGINVPVKFYYANASAGLTWPGSWTLAGTDVLPSVMPGQVIVAKVAWNPPGTGHYCILVRLDTAQDPMTFVEGPSVNTNTRNNNNIVWRNMNVVDLVAGLPPGQSGGLEANVSMIVRNTGKADREIGLVFQQEPGKVPGLFIERGTVTVHPDARLADLWKQQGHRAEGVEMLEDGSFRAAKDRATIILQLPPKEEFEITLVFADRKVNNLANQKESLVTELGQPKAQAERPKSRYRFSVVQVDAENPEKEPLGGVTYEILAPRLKVPKE